MTKLTTARVFSAVVFVLILAAASGVFTPEVDRVPVPVTVEQLEIESTVVHTFVDYPPTESD